MKALFDLAHYVWTHPLNAGGRVAALGRVLRWQIGSRLVPGAVAVPFVDATRLFVERGMTGATGNWYCGLHEHGEMAFVLHVLRDTDLFLDVGANVGSYTILASGAAGARSIAIEPVPATFARLRRNVALNGLDARVRCWQGGVSDRAGMLRFTTGLDTVNHVIAPGEQAPSVEVPVKTLDDLVGDDVPAVVKIDVEGYERPVLAGAQRTLAAPGLLAVIMETNGSGARYGVSDDELVSTMRDHGFGMFAYDPIARRLNAAERGGGNTIFVRNPEAVNVRVAAARRFSLVNGSV